MSVKYSWSRQNGAAVPPVRFMSIEPAEDYYKGMPLKLKENGIVEPTDGDPEYICMAQYDPDAEIQPLEIPVQEVFPDVIYEKINNDGTKEEVRFGSRGGGGGDPLETVETEVPLEITWDGNTEGKEFIESEGLVKVSNAIITADMIDGGKLTLTDGSNSQSVELSSSDVNGVSDTVFVVYPKGASIPFLFCVQADTTDHGITLTSGVWFVMQSFGYIESFIVNTKGEKTQLKPSLIPTHNHKWNDISDAPFYDRSKSEPLNITFDGELVGKEAVRFQMGAGDSYFVKISDAILSPNELIGATMVQTFIDVDATSEIEAILTANDIMDGQSMGGVPMYMIQKEVEGYQFIAVSALSDCSIMEGISLTPGFWVMWGLNDGQKLWISSISNPNATITTTEIKKLNPKFYDQPCYDNRVTNAKSYSYDGVLDNKTTVELAIGEYLVKVSDDIIVSANSFVGASLLGSYSSDPQIITEDVIAVNDDYIAVGEKAVVSVINDCVFNGVAITKGLWVYHSMSGYISSLSNVTITTGEIKKLDPKFYERPCYDDVKEIPFNFTFNGNVDGKETVSSGSVFFVKVSDIVIDDESVLIGSTIVSSNGDVIEVTELTVNKTENMLVANSVVYCIFANYEFMGAVLTPGIWFMSNVTRFVKDGFTFTERDLKKLDEKFMPELAQVILVSPSGKKFKTTVGDDGVLNTTEV